MGRPAKSATIKSRRASKEELNSMRETEQKIKGDNDELKPQEHLNKRQKEIFMYIYNQLKDKDILGNLDIYVLNHTAVVIERLEQTTKLINKLPIKDIKTGLKATQEQYTKQFFRCCNELCLSPQARAKLAVASTPQKEKSLSDILGDDDE
jgi:P27 family predicted phage terminase small subunit